MYRNIQSYGTILRSMWDLVLEPPLSHCFLKNASFECRLKWDGQTCVTHDVATCYKVMLSAILLIYQVTIFVVFCLLHRWKLLDFVCFFLNSVQHISTVVYFSLFFKIWVSCTRKFWFVVFESTEQLQLFVDYYCWVHLI